MTIEGRLEDWRKWERNEAGQFVRARILCGRGPEGRSTCSGPLGYYVFSPPHLLLTGMLLRADGVYRPTVDALEMYRKTGELDERITRRTDKHITRHRKQFYRRAPSPISVTRPRYVLVACPRCRLINEILIDWEDVELLAFVPFLVEE